MLPCLFEKAAGSLDVGADERGRIRNRTIHMRFGGEVHDRIDWILLKHLSDFLRVRDVAANEMISRVFRHFVKVAEISCVREQVEVQDFNVLTRAKDVTHETGTNKSGPASNEKFHCFLRMDAEPWMAACGISSAFASD